MAEEENGGEAPCVADLNFELKKSMLNERIFSYLCIVVNAIANNIFLT
ncbi:MAG: hypothetical protein IKR71_01020 [Bacteroidales bacterium]|nr:hypothetical protein [Bacteroidales bacterium]